MASITFILLPIIGKAQSPKPQEVSLKIDTTEFLFSKSTFNLRNEKYFYFEPTSREEVVEITLQFDSSIPIEDVKLNPSSDFTIVDPIISTGRGNFRGVVKFQNLASARYPRFVFTMVEPDGSSSNIEYKLYPFFKPEIRDLPSNIELYRGEERTISLDIRNAFHLKTSSNWERFGSLDYRLIRSEEGIGLQVKGNSVGNFPLSLELQADRPFLDQSGMMSNQLETINLNFQVKLSRISYVNFDQNDYFFEPAGSSSITVLMDYNPYFELNKTYRIENQEGRGGRLIAEIFTRSIIDDKKKIMANLRTYAMHRENEGYLYIKDGDNTLFFSNFNILPKPSIEKVTILRPGKDWNSNVSVYPGETIDLKIEGVGLQKALINFADGKYLAQPDTSRTSDNAQYFKMTIPIDIKETKIPIGLNGRSTRFELLVREYQRPHDMGFISINYGEKYYPVTHSRFNSPALYGSEIKEVLVAFDPNGIDANDDLYGIQYLSMTIELKDKDNRLIEIKEIDNITIVPGPNSPRYASYDQKRQSSRLIRLNDYLANKTYDVKSWSRIEITIRHKNDRYDEPGGITRLVIIRSEAIAFDLQVSFPAGLFSKRFNEAGIGRLSGISTAALAQMSFYKKNQINKLHPVRAGVGFLALNALSSLTRGGEDDTDIGMVAIVQFVPPIRPGSKVHFPLYAGFGYLFQNNTAFLLIGPGIQVNF